MSRMEGGSVRGFRFRNSEREKNQVDVDKQKKETYYSNAYAKSVTQRKEGPGVNVWWVLAAWR